MIINTKYDLENLQNIGFPFKISDIEKDGFINYFKINDIQFSINNYEDYIKFGYHLKREFDLNPKNSNGTIDISSLNQYIYLDGGMNVVTSINEVNITNKEKYLFNTFKSKSIKCFWGTILSDELVNIGRKKVIKVEYSPHSKDGMTTRVLVQPKEYNYDEAFFVYVDSALKPTYPVEVLYKFSNNDGVLNLDKIYSNNWVY